MVLTGFVMFCGVLLSCVYTFSLISSALFPKGVSNFGFNIYRGGMMYTCMYTHGKSIHLLFIIPTLITDITVSYCFFHYYVDIYDFFLHGILI